ncbi:hypothetical protein Y1Q_0001879 [Alligator mississippiensis]|uniref:Uncharacterized protein n=1 Tax=Alligator mississippiensis TaxID=8496 RepID=A0A151PGB2_ALLMI|nr:hypothetical protein Y1Q_0001879 [Alligator mississippiensis]
MTRERTTALQHGTGYQRPIFEGGTRRSQHLHAQVEIGCYCHMSLPGLPNVTLDTAGTVPTLAHVLLPMCHHEGTWTRARP